MIPHNMTTTQLELDGYKIVRSLGVVRGIIVRSRSIFGTIGASLQTLVGGNITLLTNLCEKARENSFDLMLEHAAVLGANAVVGVRYGDHRDHARRERGPLLRHSRRGGACPWVSAPRGQAVP